jgi:hypothetical protein
MLYGHGDRAENEPCHIQYNPLLVGVKGRQFLFFERGRRQVPSATRLAIISTKFQFANQ